MQKLLNRVKPKLTEHPFASREAPIYLSSANLLEVIPFSYSDPSTLDPLTPQRRTTTLPDHQPPIYPQSRQSTPPLNIQSQAPPPPQPQSLQPRRLFEEFPFANENAQLSNEAVDPLEDLQEKDAINVGVRVSLSRRKGIDGLLRNGTRSASPLRT